MANSNGFIFVRTLWMHVFWNDFEAFGRVQNVLVAGWVLAGDDLASVLDQLDPGILFQLTLVHLNLLNRPISTFLKNLLNEFQFWAVLLRRGEEHGLRLILRSGESADCNWVGVGVEILLALSGEFEG
jgi:hypothetical protein